MTSFESPRWLHLVERLAPAIFDTGVHAPSRLSPTDGHLQLISTLALYHLDVCLKVSMEANGRQLFSVAACLIRQCVEALSIVELGVQRDARSLQKLQSWHDGKASLGEVRQHLEAHVWSKHGLGLWDESWGEFYGNLAKAVQAYAHYTPDLMNWQFAFLGRSGMPPENNGRFEFQAAITPGSPDPIKASRITLLHALLLWALGRVAASTTPEYPRDSLSQELAQLGALLSQSKLLLGRRQWADELAAHAWFATDRVEEWLDE